MSFWAAFLKKNGKSVMHSFTSFDYLESFDISYVTGSPWSFGNFTEKASQYLVTLRVLDYWSTLKVSWPCFLCHLLSSQEVHEACWYSVRCYTWFTVISSVREKVAKDATRTQTVTIFCEMPLWIMYSKVKRRHRSFLCHPCLSWLRLSQWKILCLNGVVFQQSPKDGLQIVPPLLEVFSSQNNSSTHPPIVWNLQSMARADGTIPFTWKLTWPVQSQSCPPELKKLYPPWN